MKMTEKDFLALVKEINLLESTLALTGWDVQTGMPEKASDYRTEQEAFLSQLLFERLTGKRMREAMEHFDTREDELSDFGKKVFAKVKEDYDVFSALSEEDFDMYQRAVSLSYNAWLKARESKNFADFKEFLGKIIELKRKFIPLWRKDEKTPYDVLLNQYEPGMTVEILDEIFDKVRDGILAIRATLAEKGVEPETDFLSRTVSREQQEAFARNLAEQLGFDFSRGRLDVAVHPFMTGFNRNDVRLTTKWNETDFQMGVFGVLHEQGHGQYEQNVAEQYVYTPLASDMSMGLHESQSLFQEIMIGSNEAFWQKQYPLFQKITKGTFDDVPFGVFYRGLKKSQASFIRIEADTLTYVLHIIIRYEVEKAIFNENVPVEQLPELWNNKYEEYLGIRPSNDLEGVLQDIHWSGGDFGYFPSYALGYMYAAQMKHSMKADLDFEEVLLSDDYQPIKHWLDKKVRTFGASMKPKEVLFHATGEDLNPEYLLEELKKLYYNVYQIEN